MAATVVRPRLLPPWAIGALGAGLAILAALLGTVLAVVGGDLGCLGGGGGAGGGSQPSASRSVSAEIPARRLRLYQQAGRRFDLDWTFLASIAAQECDHRSTCRGTNSSGCAGPMQIAYVRGSACSPGSGPTLWERYGVDGDSDGDTDVNDPADAIPTAARVLRQAKSAPPAGGSYAAYRRAACNYYGACSDTTVAYAEQVMHRAVQYGFDGAGAPEPTDSGQAEPTLASSGGSRCGGSVPVGGLGSARRAYEPKRLEALPADVTAGQPEQCDARIVADVTYLARRFDILVTDCYAASGHTASGEHPLGAAIDAVPKGGDWSQTERLARALGWQDSCAAQGLRPACADPPFRFIGYNGFPNHGDPQSCVPCAGGPHIHLSWQTSSSPGQPGNQARYGYEPAAWIEVLAERGHASDEGGHGRYGEQQRQRREPRRRDRGGTS